MTKIRIRSQTMQTLLRELRGGSATEEPYFYDPETFFSSRREQKPAENNTERPIRLKTTPLQGDVEETYTPAVQAEQTPSTLPAPYSPSLQDLISFYKDHGLVGEEPLAVLQTLGAINKQHFGIESLSGSGKSYTMDILLDLLPKDSVYTMELSSATAEFYNAAEINRRPLIYIPELQKAMRTNRELTTEILKNLAEGKAARRRVRNQREESTDEFVITPGKGVMFTLAVENDFKYDAEFSRRVFILRTDVSEEQTERILQATALRQQGGNRHASKNYQGLREHIAYCLSHDEFDYINPFAAYVAQQIPTNIRSRSWGQYLFGLMNSSAKFHLQDRTREAITLVLNMQDVYNIQQIYWKQFCEGLLRIPLFAEEVIDAVEKSGNGRGPDARDVYKQLENTAPMITYNLARQTLEQLADAGYLEKDGYHSTNPRYARADRIPDYRVDFNWAECWEKGVSYMESWHPDLLEEWVNRQTVGGYPVLKNPLDGKASNLQLVEQ
ncbi:MAG: hypothetical protein EPN86_04005 [Nanoarchaeota archaeon]|nr:MAG: hypothetical protein EPN86_04005 [Nanoarchaeota archaeon]